MGEIENDLHLIFTKISIEKLEKNKRKRKIFNRTRTFKAKYFEGMR